MFRAIARTALATTTRHAAATQMAPRAAAAASATLARQASQKLRVFSASSAAATTAASSSSQPRRRASLSSLTPAVEVLDSASASHFATRLLLTCEHASEALPAGWHWTHHDARLHGTHWASDPGAEEFTRALSASMPSVAVLARFSRLLCDANRPLGADTMFRAIADGIAVGLNDPSALTAAERARRVDQLWRPYHASLHLAVQEIEPTMVLSVHSFTPEYEGQKREVEVGVLYNSERDRHVAEKFLTAFRAAGMRTELNAPWSAKDGFMYAADQFSAEGTHVLMFEFRNDLCTNEEWRRKALVITRKVLNELGHK